MIIVRKVTFQVQNTNANNSNLTDTYSYTSRNKIYLQYNSNKTPFNYLRIETHSLKISKSNYSPLFRYDDNTFSKMLCEYICEHSL